MKTFHIALLASLIQIPAWAGTPTGTTKIEPCAKTKVGCAGTVNVVPRGNDPGIMPIDAKKPAAKQAVKPIEAKPSVAAPQIKPDKVAAPK